MIWFLVLFVALILKTVLIAGNTQSNNKKSPVKSIRNNSSGKDGNGEILSSPPARPPTAIDPLSHVCLLSASLYVSQTQLQPTDRLLIVSLAHP